MTLSNLNPNKRLSVPQQHDSSKSRTSHVSQSADSSITVPFAGLLDVAPHQRLSSTWMHKSGASRIPQPASPSSTAPSYAFSLWRRANGEIHVPHLAINAGSRYPKVHLTPSGEIHCWPPPAEYPMTAELEAKVRLQLQQDYRDCKRGKHCRAMKDSWRAESGIFRLDSVEAPPRAIHQSNVSRFCNKATVFYWAPSAQRYGGCPGIIFGAIYKAWFRYYNDKPGKLALDYDYFFANLVKVTTNGPKTIPGIVKAHRSLSDQVVSLLSRMRQECKTGTCPIRDDKLLPHHQLQLLSRAIVVIYDNFIEPYVVREPRVRIFLDEVVQQQNVLLVLTGDDHELSAPISFDSIKCESLPTAQEASDGTETGDSYDMIRVPLNVAIQFILDLQQRESVAKSCPWTESTIAEPTNDGPSSDAVDRDAAEYADSIIRSTAQGRGREDDSAKLAMGAMNFAAEMVAMRERGEEIPPALGVDMIEPLWE